MKRYTLPFSLILLAFASCKGFENDIELVLDPYESKLMVECYLEPGKPLRLLLTETKGYFEEFQSFPLVDSAEVIIQYGNVRDTLIQPPILPTPDGQNLRISFDAISNKFYNYLSKNGTICPLLPNEPFTLYIKDTKNRSTTATTRYIAPITFDSVKWEFNGSKYSAWAFFKDNAGQQNNYRSTIHENSISSKPIRDGSFTDNVINGQEAIPIATRYDYERDDTLIFTICHLDTEYYNFLENTLNSIRRGSSPFSQPTRFTTNLSNGALGIFTFLSMHRDTVITGF